MAGAANAAPTARASALFFIPLSFPVLPFLYVEQRTSTRVNRSHATSASLKLSTMKGAIVSCAQHWCAAPSAKRARRPATDRLGSATVRFEVVALGLEQAAELARYAGLRQSEAAVRRHLGDDRHVVFGPGHGLGSPARARVVWRAAPERSAERRVGTEGG